MSLAERVPGRFYRLCSRVESPINDTRRHSHAAVPADGQLDTTVFLPSWDNLYREVRQASVFFYTFPEGAEGGNLASLAEDLLLEVQHVLSSRGSDKPLHFACHSTGGLVVKLALALAHESADKTRSEIAASCFSVAFFGVPRKWT